MADEAIVALRATVQYGTGTAAALPNADVAGKTGTTDNSVDAWFNGITPTLVSSVWMGDPNGEVPMYVDGTEVYGADYPTQIWHDVMAYALRDVPYSSFPDPNPDLMPPVEYIISPSLEQDDLLSHGGVGAPSCVWDGQLVPCPTTTLPPPPPTAPTTTGSGSTTSSHPTTSRAPTTTVPPTVPGYAGGGPVTTFAVPKSPTTAPPVPTTAAPLTTAAPSSGQNQGSPPTASPPGQYNQGGGAGFGQGGRVGQRGSGGGQNLGYGP